MKKILTLISLVSMLVLTGCSYKDSAAYDYEDHNKIKQVLVGKVINTRDVYIKSEDSDKLLGSIAGAVLGSTIGSGDGSTVASVGGAILGGIVGDEVGKVKAQELTVVLNDDKTIVVLSKDTKLQNGDKIRIVKVDNKVSSVYKIEN